MKRIHQAILLAMPVLLWACGTSKQAVSSGGKHTAATTGATTDSAVKASRSAGSTLAFVQRVSDNRVYAQNIVANMTFSVDYVDMNISAPGSLRMRRYKMIRLQLFIPLIGTEVGRIDFTPDYVLVVDRLHKQYVRGDYSQLDFLRDNGLDFYSLQSLFWNQLLLPGTKKIGESDLQKFTANLDGTGQNVPVTLNYNKLSLTWLADRATALINQAKVAYASKASGRSALTWNYSDFTPVGAKKFPTRQEFSFTTTKAAKVQTVTVTLDMEEPKTTEGWDTETTLSSKYKQMDARQILDKLLSM